MLDDEEGEDFITCVIHVCVGCIIRQNVCTYMYLVQKACSIPGVRYSIYMCLLNKPTRYKYRKEF